MALALNALTSSSDPGDKTSYVTASVAPSANALVVVAVVYADNGSIVTSPTLTGGGMTTWTLIIEKLFGLDRRRIAFYRALQASPGSGTITMDFGADTMTGCMWSVFEITGVDPSGTNGSGAVVQSDSTSHASGSGAAHADTVTLSAFGSADNRPVAAFGAEQNSTTEWTEEAGYTQIHAVAIGAPIVCLETMWHSSSADESPTSTHANDVATGAIAFEVKSDGGLTRKWSIPTSASDGNAMRIRIFNGANNTIDDSTASQAAASGVYKFACADQGIAVGTLKFATLEDWDGNTATVDISGALAIAEVIEE